MTAPASSRGRLTPERQAELYGNVLDLLREVGYDALTMDAMAARGHASKATLYRQWGSKAELVVQALRHRKPVRPDLIDTGSLRRDFHELVEGEDECRMAEDNALMRGLTRAVHDNPELRQAFREKLIAPEINGVDQMLKRAVDRGEVAADNPAVPYVVHMLVGAFVTRQWIDELPPDKAYLRNYLDSVVLPALGV